MEVKITKSTRYLLTALAAFADKHGVVKFVGIKTIAREADICERQARRLLKRLERYRLIEVTRPPGDCCEFRLPGIAKSMQRNSAG